MLLAARNHREARAKFRELIAAGEISWTNHVKARMRERDITIREIKDVLEAGYEVEGPIRNERMNWSCTFAGNPAGVGVRVVAVLIEEGDETCLLVTVMN